MSTHFRGGVGIKFEDCTDCKEAAPKLKPWCAVGSSCWQHGLSVHAQKSVDGENLALLSIKRTSNLVFVGSPSNSEPGRPCALVFLIIMYTMRYVHYVCITLLFLNHMWSEFLLYFTVY